MSEHDHKLGFNWDTIPQAFPSPAAIEELIVLEQQRQGAIDAIRKSLETQFIDGFAKHLTREGYFDGKRNDKKYSLQFSKWLSYFKFMKEKSAENELTAQIVLTITHESVTETALANCRRLRDDLKSVHIMTDESRDQQRNAYAYECVSKLSLMNTPLPKI